jgi:hypothetical protein
VSTTRVRPSGHVGAEAEAIHDAAELLWSSGDLARLSRPLIVNYAFSAELSLNGEGPDRAAGLETARRNH